MSSSSRTFQIDRKLNPEYSLLGRLVRKAAANQWQAGSYFILGLVGLILLIIVAQQLAWVFVEEAVSSNPLGPTALIYWFSQVGAISLVIVGAFLGFSDLINVDVDEGILKIRRNNDVTNEIPLAHITSLQVVDALTFHREIRRSPDVLILASRVVEPVLLLSALTGKVVLGLDEDDRQTLMKIIERSGVRRAPDARIPEHNAAAIA